MKAKLARALSTARVLPTTPSQTRRATHHPDHDRYGNLVPAANPGQPLAILEMLTGQLLLVTAVAKVVSTWRPGRPLTQDDSGWANRSCAGTIPPAVGPPCSTRTLVGGRAWLLGGDAPGGEQGQ